MAPTHIKERCNINNAILSDSEIITISIVGEFLTIDSEKAWYHFIKKNLKNLFPHMCDRGRFNQTRRNLYEIIGEIRKYIISILGCKSQFYVCKFGRAHFHKTFKVDAEYRYCASKKETYYEFKLHVITILDGFITDFLLTPANIDDSEAIWELVDSYRSITVIGDNGYINKYLIPELEAEKGIQLILMKRNNSKSLYSKSFHQHIFKNRRRIETTFSQLTEQLNIDKALAKSLWGLITRLKTKILAHNLCYFINTATR